MMFRNWYSVEYLLTAGLKWMEFCSNRFVSNVSSVWKPIWRGLLISWQELWIILVSSNSKKFLVFLVLLDLFINKIASYNQEYLLPRYFSIFMSFKISPQKWIEFVWTVICFSLFLFVYLYFSLFCLGK